MASFTYHSVDRVRPKCKHEDSLCTVSLGGLSIAEFPNDCDILCENCFVAHFDDWKTAEINSMPSFPFIVCGLCEKHPARVWEDLTEAHCDDCYKNSNIQNILHNQASSPADSDPSYSAVEATYPRSICLLCQSSTSHEWMPLCDSCLDANNPLKSIECSTCGESPSRIWVGLCDKCRLESERQEMEFYSLSNSPRSKAAELPDEIGSRNLFLGSQKSAVDIDTFKILRIKRVLICGSYLPMVFKDDNRATIRYHRLPMKDSHDEDILRYLQDAMDFIEDSLSSNENVLIHCYAGISRSATVCIAWFMYKYGWSYDEAYVHVLRKRGNIYPNSRFEKDLRTVWEPKYLNKSLKPVESVDKLF